MRQIPAAVQVIPLAEHNGDIWLAGVDVKTVQKLAGHRSVETTLKYFAAVSQKGSIEIIERMSDFTKIEVA